MFLNLGFPLGSLMFLSISLMMYFIKKKYNDFQNKLFKYLLLVTYALPILELLYVTTINNMDKIPIINEIICRLFLTGIIVWAFTFFSYIISIGLSSSKYKEKSEKIIPKFIFVGSALVAVLDLFFKVQYVTDYGSYAPVGPAMYFVCGIAGFLLVILFVAIIIKSDYYSDALKIPLFFSIVLIGADMLNLFVLNINDLTLIFSLIVSSLYFTIESQDRMLLKEVGEARNKSERVNKAKTEFLTSMSHEIRTPMNTILGFSNSLLMEKKLTREQILEDAQNINKASVDLLNLINNILDISRIESGKEVINEKDYKLSDVLSEINNLLISRSKEKKCWYDLEINKDIPIGYHGDYAKVVKIVSFLINNAIKYSDNGYINVSVNLEQRNNKDFLLFIITNSKSHMPIDLCNRDFSDFSKLDYSNTNRMDSDFLGLVIAKRLAGLFEDSNIVFKQEKNNVTKCNILIGQKVIDRNAIGDDFLNSDANMDIDCSGKKALIVDDNEINLKLAEKLLKSYNFVITKAKSGNECVNLVKANDYDIIFLDHMMPELDGVHTMHILKRMQKNIPFIVAMTANSDTNSKDYYEKEGFNAYIGKPINKKKLDALIAEVFGGKS